MDKKYAEKSIFRSKFCAPDRSATEQIWLSSSVNIQRNRREKRSACLILHFGGKKEKPSSVYVRTTPFERGKECLVFASPTTMVQFPNSQQAPKSTFLNWKRPYSSTLHPSPPPPLHGIAFSGLQTPDAGCLLSCFSFDRFSEPAAGSPPPLFSHRPKA